MELTEEQKETLRSYQKKIVEAMSDLDDSIKTEYMSDTKSSVYALERTESMDGLPEDIQNELKRLSAAAWSTVSGGDSVYSRVSKTSFNVAEIRRYVKSLLG